MRETINEQIFRVLTTETFISRLDSLTRKQFRPDGGSSMDPVRVRFRLRLKTKFPGNDPGLGSGDCVLLPESD